MLPASNRHNHHLAESCGPAGVPLRVEVFQPGALLGAETRKPGALLGADILNQKPCWALKSIIQDPCWALKSISREHLQRLLIRISQFGAGPGAIITNTFDYDFAVWDGPDAKFTKTFD